jgi:AraC-like DNA-binding protein
VDSGRQAAGDTPFEDMVQRLTISRRDPELLYAPGASAPELLPPGEPPAYEFAFALRGALRVRTAPDHIFELSGRRLLLIGKGVEHDELPPDPPRPYAACWCWVEGTTGVIHHSYFTPPRRLRSGHSVRLPGRTSVESTVMAIEAELRDREWGWGKSVQGLLTHLANTLIRRLRRGAALHLRVREHPAVAADPSTWRALGAALRYCEANFRTPFGLDELAAAVGYSPSYISRLASHHLGQPLFDYVRSLRVVSAKHLLDSTSMSIGDIAGHLGYADIASFSHAFKRLEGVSPRAYRRSHHDL